MNYEYILEARGGEDVRELRSKLRLALRQDRNEALRLYRCLWIIGQDAALVLDADDGATEKEVQKTAEALLTRKSASHYNALLKSSWAPDIAPLDLFGAFGPDGFKSADFMRGVRALAENGCAWQEALNRLAESRLRRETGVTRQGVVRRGREWIAWDGLQAMKAYLASDTLELRNEPTLQADTARSRTEAIGLDSSPKFQLQNAEGNVSPEDRNGIMDIDGLWLSPSFVNTSSPPGQSISIEPRGSIEELAEYPASFYRAYTWPAAEWPVFDFSVEGQSQFSTGTDVMLPTFTRSMSDPLDSSLQSSDLSEELQLDRDSVHLNKPKISQPTFSYAIGNLAQLFKPWRDSTDAMVSEHKGSQVQKPANEGLTNDYTMMPTSTVHMLHPFFVRSTPGTSLGPQLETNMRSTQVKGPMRNEKRDSAAVVMSQQGPDHSDMAKSIIDIDMSPLSFPGAADPFEGALNADLLQKATASLVQDHPGPQPALPILADLLPRSRLHGATLNAVMQLLAPNLESMHIFESRDCSTTEKDPLRDRQCRLLSQDSTEYLFFPLNFDQCHWVLGYLDVKNHLYGIHDPLQSTSYRGPSIAALQAFITNADLDVAQWSAIPIDVNVSRQTNDHDCGVHVAGAGLRLMHNMESIVIRHPDLWRRVFYVALSTAVPVSADGTSLEAPFSPEEIVESKHDQLRKNALHELVSHLQTDVSIADRLLSNSASIDALQHRLSICDDLSCHLVDAVAELKSIQTLCQRVSEQDRDILIQWDSLESSVQKCQRLLDLASELEEEHSDLPFTGSVSEVAQHLKTMQTRAKDLARSATKAKQRSSTLETVLKFIETDLSWYHERISLLRSESVSVRGQLEKVANHMLQAIIPK